ncbi:MAG: hypothetical protein IKL53_06125 [Lachnospiraceae bacterium]|nr:hypothetical protein [Lachnospiraceae bacterium]
MQGNNNITNINEYRANNMPGNSGFNINEAEYANQVEFVSDEMVNAYMQTVDMQTPDLWSRIEAGFETENAELIKERKLKQARNKKLIGFAAAAVLITVIAIPILSANSIDKEEKMSRDYRNEVVQEMGQSMESEMAADEMVTEAYLEDSADGACESVNESGELQDDSSFSQLPHEDQSSIEDNEIIPSGVVLGTEEDVLDVEGVQTDSRTITVEGEFVYSEGTSDMSFEITKVGDNEYDELEIKLGDNIILINPDYIHVMSIDIGKVRLTFDSVKIDDFGNIIARIIDLEHIE